MREQLYPFVTLPIMESEAPCRRIGLEIGCDIAKSQAHVGISVRGKGAPIRDLRHGEFKTYAKTISGRRQRATRAPCCAGLAEKTGRQAHRRDTQSEIGRTAGRGRGVQYV